MAETTNKASTLYSRMQQVAGSDANSGSLTKDVSDFIKAASNSPLINHKTALTAQIFISENKKLRDTIVKSNATVTTSLRSEYSKVMTGIKATIASPFISFGKSFNGLLGSFKGIFGSFGDFARNPFGSLGKKFGFGLSKEEKEEKKKLQREEKTFNNITSITKDVNSILSIQKKLLKIEQDKLRNNLGRTSAGSKIAEIGTKKDSGMFDWIKNLGSSVLSGLGKSIGPMVSGVMKSIIPAIGTVISSMMPILAAALPVLLAAAAGASLAFAVSKTLDVIDEKRAHKQTMDATAQATRDVAQAKAMSVGRKTAEIAAKRASGEDVSADLNILANKRLAEAILISNDLDSDNPSSLMSQYNDTWLEKNKAPLRASLREKISVGASALSNARAKGLKVNSREVQVYRNAATAIGAVDLLDQIGDPLDLYTSEEAGQMNGFGMLGLDPITSRPDGAVSIPASNLSVLGRLGSKLASLTAKTNLATTLGDLKKTLGVSSKGMSQYSDSIALASSDVDINGLNPSTKKKLLDMADDFYKNTGHQIVVNSAKRSLQKQAQLYSTLPKGQAAPPGRSLHNFGTAIDISTPVSNELDRLGYYGAYGFNRPYLNRGAKSEPWHIEDTAYNTELLKQQGSQIASNWLSTGKLPYPDPYLAEEGAVLNGNRPVIAGEAGPEAIVPLNDQGLNFMVEALNKVVKISQPPESKTNGIDTEGFKNFLVRDFVNALAAALKTNNEGNGFPSMVNTFA